MRRPFCTTRVTNAYKQWKVVPCRVGAWVLLWVAGSFGEMEPYGAKDSEGAREGIL